MRLHFTAIFAVVTALYQLTSAAPVIASSESRDALSKRSIGGTIAKVGLSAAFAGAVAAAFLEATHLSNQMNASPDEGAFNSNQETAINTWFDTQPTEIWQGDQILDRLSDTPNVSQREMAMFTKHWNAKKAKLQAAAAKASQNNLS